MSDKLQVTDLRAKLADLPEYAGQTLRFLTAKILLEILDTLVDIKHELGHSS